MRLVIDLQGAQTESRRRGIGRYSMSLLRAMLEDARGHDILIVLNQGFEETIAPLQADLADLVTPAQVRLWSTPTPACGADAVNRWRNAAGVHLRESFLASLLPDVVLVLSLFEGHVDDAVTSVNVGSYGLPTAVILFDLIPLVHRQTYLADPNAARWYDEKLEQLKRADLLLSISESSRVEAIHHLAFAPEHIVNVSTAADERFQPMTIDADREQALRQSLGLVKPFVMYTGGADWRKNLARLIEAYAALPANIRAGLQLALVGSMPEGNVMALREMALGYGLAADELVLTGYVSDEVLHQLYCLCHCFIFPSWHEGFGLPPLEAMACGAVTVGARATSIPEVIGNDEALFDPLSIESMKDRLTAAISDENFRQRVVRSGLAQARTFSWRHSAELAWKALEARFAPSNEKDGWSRYQKQRASNHLRLINSVADLGQVSGIGADEADLLATARCIAANQLEADATMRAGLLPERISWRIEGPFDSTYSLAQLNRMLALAMDEAGQTVVLHSTEGPGDFDPSFDFLQRNPELQRLYLRSKDPHQPPAQISSRLLYPPRVDDMASRVNLLHIYAWEESGFPAAWVDAFNTHLQGMTCLSRHVEKIMVDNGVSVPLSVSSVGVDHWQTVTADAGYRLQARGFRFLHVSSCFPRKGVDVLLAAYGQAFTAADDVTLVIKTFVNPHNQIQEWLAAASHGRSDFPDVQIIESDLSDEQLKSLYKQCHALVGVSRAEGFGLPFAEAMLSGLDVITTNWGGQLDFCSPQSAWLVDYDFASAKTHFGLFNSVWAEPRVAHLTEVLRQARGASPESRLERTRIGRDMLLSEFRWQQVAERHLVAARQWAAIPRRPAPRLGFVSTWNVRCGISSYSSHLLVQLPQQVTILAAKTTVPVAADQPNVFRCWETSEEEPLFELEDCIERHRLDTLLIQFNYGFFNLEMLARFIARQHAAGRVIILMMHATVDPAHAPHKKLSVIRDALALCDRLLVHNVDDLNRLKTLGLVENATLFPLGLMDHRSVAPATITKKRTLTLASYGFFLPHKGLLELIDTVVLLRMQGITVKLRMVNAEYPVTESKDLIELARQKIRQHRLEKQVSLHTEFLDDTESLRLLSEADAIVFPYQQTAESASGAVRYGIATGKLVVVTPLPIFQDMASAVTRLPGCDVSQMAAGIAELIKEIQQQSPRLKEQEKEAARWREAHSYKNLGLRLHHMMIALHRGRIATPSNALSMIEVSAPQLATRQ